MIPPLLARIVSRIGSAPRAVALGALGGFLYLLPYGGLLLSFVIALLIAEMRRVRPIPALIVGFLFAAAYQLAAMSWFWNTVRFIAGDAPAISMLAAIGFAAFTLALTSAAAGFAFLPWAALVNRFRFRALPDALFIAALWTGCEYLRVALISLFFAGDGILDPFNFSFGMVGYALADYPGALGLAAVGGVAALSFAITFAGGLLYHAVRAHSRAARVKITAAAVLVCALALLPAWRVLVPFHPGAEIPLTLITFYQADESHPIMAGGEGPSIIVAPEGSRWYAPFSAHAPNIPPGNVIIDSGNSIEADGVKPLGLATAVSPERTTLIREKAVLAPYGEYLPAATAYFARVSGFSESLAAFTRERRYRIGSYEGSFTYGDARASVIFCNEIAVPGIARRLTEDLRLNLVVVIASSRWFPDSRALHREVIRMMRVQAVEAGVPLARSAAGDPATAIDRYGRLLYEGSWDASSAHLIRISVEDR